MTNTTAEFLKIRVQQVEWQVTLHLYLTRECGLFLFCNFVVVVPRGIVNVRTDVKTCDCTQGLYGHHKRVCTGSWLWESGTHISLAPWLFSQTFYQLSYCRPTGMGKQLHTLLCHCGLGEPQCFSWGMLIHEQNAMVKFKMCLGDRTLPLVPGAPAE